MELVKIVGGLAVIAVIVVVVGLDRQDGSEQAAAPKQAERTFTSGSSSARFVSVPKD
jgi:hypothetical protein